MKTQPSRLLSFFHGLVRSFRRGLMPGRRHRRAVTFCAFMATGLVAGQPCTQGAENLVWEWRNPLPQGHTLQSVVHVDDKLIAVGSGGTIVTSDGIELRARTLGSTINLFDIAWNGSIYVAVGSKDGNLVTVSSPDGESWSIQPFEDSGSLRAVIWNGSSFFTAGTGGRIRQSEDGTHWETRDVTASAWFEAIVWTGDQLVAVGGVPGGGRTPPRRVVATSEDGIDWHVQETSDTTPLTSIAWNGSRYIATVDWYPSILGSTNAADWETVHSTGDARAQSVTWNGSEFLAVGTNGSFFRSTDGLSWTHQEIGFGGVLQSITPTPNGAAVVGNGGFFAVSDTLSDWTTLTSGFFETLHDVSWNGERFIAVGDNGRILTSTEGIDWTPFESGTTEILFGLLETEEKIVAVGTNGRIVVSEAGAPFEVRESGVSAALRDIAGSGERYVAVGHSGTIVTSADATTWSEVETSTNVTLYSIAWQDGLFVAVGGNGTILTSPDGNEWEIEDSITIWPLEGVGIASSGTTWVATGAQRSVVTSSNGKDWQNIANAVEHNISSLYWSGTEFIGLGTGWISTSPDGSTWESARLPVTHALNATAWDGRQYIVVGTHGSILSGVAHSPKNTFTAWLHDHFDETELENEALSDPESDPGGFGINHLLRYAFDLDPRHPNIRDLSHVATTSLEDPEGDYLVITFSRRINAADLEYRVESGDQPGSWQHLDENYFVEASPGENDGSELVTYRDSVPIGETDSRFMRVTVMLVD